MGVWLCMCVCHWVCCCICSMNIKNGMKNRSAPNLSSIGFIGEYPRHACGTGTFPLNYCVISKSIIIYAYQTRKWQYQGNGTEKTPLKLP